MNEANGERMHKILNKIKYTFDSTDKTQSHHQKLIEFWKHFFSRFFALLFASCIRKHIQSVPVSLLRESILNGFCAGCRQACRTFTANKIIRCTMCVWQNSIYISKKKIGRKSFSLCKLDAISVWWFRCSPQSCEFFEESRKYFFFVLFACIMQCYVVSDVVVAYHPNIIVKTFFCSAQAWSRQLISKCFF